MLDYKTLEEQGKAAGLTHIVPLDCTTIQIMTEVRDMCADNKCGKFGASWACPPGCGTLEECSQKVHSFQRGILVQTVGTLEDSMDYENMMETERLHKEHITAFDEYIRQEYPGRLFLGSGTCTRCKTCTYPDEPCRFPEKAFSSMEAFGMLVTQVCQANDLPYYYGENSIAYTSCYLLE